MAGDPASFGIGQRIEHHPSIAVGFGKIAGAGRCCAIASAHHLRKLRRAVRRMEIQQGIHFPLDPMVHLRLDLMVRDQDGGSAQDQDDQARYRRREDRQPPYRTREKGHWALLSTI